MKNQLIYVILLLLTSCVNSTSKQEVQIENLIKDNKDNSLFLSFWKGMSEDEFDLVKQFENETGNLKSGKFLLNNNIPFDVCNNSGYSISLSYEDTQWSSYSCEPYKAIENTPSGNPYKYQKIENLLIEYFNMKYEKIIEPNDIEKFDPSQYDEFISTAYKSNPPNKEHNVNIQWRTRGQENDRLISLSVDYYFLDRNYNYETSLSGAARTFYHDKKNKRIKVGYCSISITYFSLKDYLANAKKQDLRKIKQEKLRKEDVLRRAEEKSKLDSLIKRNNNNL